MLFPNPGLDWIEMALQHHAGLEKDEHGTDTPNRFLNMLGEMTRCRFDDDEHTDDCIKWKAFKNEGMDEMIVQTDLPFVSLCNHHVVPIRGVVHIAYIPKDFVCGLSKLNRVVQHYARRLQVQERMTKQIADELEKRLLPIGLAVMVQAEHMCMTIRGTQAHGALTTTSDMRGVFADHSRTAKAEFLQIVGSSK